jgi:hypothetical protein
MSRMIPLKIADMAVAACNEEIAKLQAENVRLKSDVERLNTGIQPEGSNDAVGRAVNVLLEKEKEIARLKGRVIALEAQVESEKAIAKALRSLSFTTAVPSEDYEKLKAELAKSEEHNAALCERLQDLNGEVHTASCINGNLHAKVARLIKAGTAMGMCLPDTDEANASYRAFEYAAKGGQS